MKPTKRAERLVTYLESDCGWECHEADRRLCKKCGHSEPDVGRKFCSDCGTKLPKATFNAMWEEIEAAIAFALEEK